MSSKGPLVSAFASPSEVCDTHGPFSEGADLGVL